MIGEVNLAGERARAVVPKDVVLSGSIHPYGYTRKSILGTKEVESVRAS
jgi:hypothetical protein